MHQHRANLYSQFWLILLCKNDHCHNNTVLKLQMAHMQQQEYQFFKKEKKNIGQQQPHQRVNLCLLCLLSLFASVGTVSTFTQHNKVEILSEQATCWWTYCRLANSCSSLSPSLFYFVSIEGQFMTSFFVLFKENNSKKESYPLMKNTINQIWNKCGLFNCSNCLLVIIQSSSGSMD